MKCKILLLIITLQLDYMLVQSLYNCQCTESAVPCPNIHKCVNCVFYGNACEMLQNNITNEEQCSSLLLNSDTVNGVEWSRTSSECRLSNCNNLKIEPSTNNRTVYWKTCDSGCSAFTVNKYQDRRVIANCTISTMSNHQQGFEDECFGECVSPTAPGCIATYGSTTFSVQFFFWTITVTNYVCEVYHGCNTSQYKLDGESGSTSYMFECNDTGLLCSAVHNPTHGVVNASAGLNFGAKAIYSCDLGYKLTGSSTQLCLWNGNWDIAAPTCSPVDCGEPSQLSNGSVNFNTTKYTSLAIYSCDSGFILNGTYNRTCEGTGNWSDSKPTCNVRDCGVPRPPANGSVNHTGTTFNSQATYSCNTGYNMTGSANTTCQENGQWSGSTPTCTIKYCGVPSQPTNGTVNYTLTTFNSKAIYSCNTGYNLTGAANTTCQDDGQWSGSTPTCIIKDCGVPSQPGNGSVNYTTTTFNSLATYSCYTGYNLNGSANTTCQENGQWSISTPTCIIKDCGEPNQPVNGSVNYTTTTFNSLATYSCNTGYNLIGSVNATCEDNGQWGGSLPTCVIKDCGVPSQPGNGSVNYTTTTFNSQATYSCNTGYNLTGSANTTCQDNGQWVGSTPTCTIEDCGVPNQPGNGSANYTTTTFNSQTTYSCNSGYDLNGSANTTCQDNGQWGGFMPICTIKNCGVPSPPSNGSVNYTTTTFNSQATYSCHTGYNLTGSADTTCQDDGQWSGSKPTCTIKDCGEPDQPVNGSVNYTTTTFNSQATFSCNTGYSLTGSGNTTCQDSGQWSDFTPTCTIIDCGVPSQPVNGSVSYTTSTFDSQATYSCNTGYNLTGSLNTTCQEYGQWSLSVPTCTIKDCGVPDQLSNGSVNYTTTTFNSHATYSCNTGYDLIGSTNTTCQHNGQWDGSTPTCMIKDCGEPVQPVNGSVNYTTTTFNSQANFSCNKGCFMTGFATTFCQDNGVWSVFTPTCTYVDCGAPNQPSNGLVSYTTTSYTSNVTYSCNEGFRLTGSTNVICEPTGNWSDAPPTCIIEDCGPHLPPANGTVDYTTTTFNSSAIYSCNAGFLLTSSSISTCTFGGNWSDSPPKCKFIDCGVPQQVENGQVYFNETTYGSQAVYGCNQGFNISGQSRRTCKATGFWGPSVPYCLAPGQNITRPRLYIKPCICYTNRTFVNMTKDQILAHLVKETSIDTKNTSAALNKLRSRSDSRTSSVVMGTIGIVILSTLGGLILCSDLLTICKNRDAKNRQTVNRTK